MAEKNHSRSRKISELKAWSTLPQHQTDSWLPVAQYDSRVKTYTNIAVNINAITSYSVYTAYNISAQYSDENLTYSINYTNKWVDVLNREIQNASGSAYTYAYSMVSDVSDQLNALRAWTSSQQDSIDSLLVSQNQWISFSNIAKGTNYEEVATYINNDAVASTLVGYTFTYTMDALDWQRILGALPEITTNSHIDNQYNLLNLTLNKKWLETN